MIPTFVRCVSFTIVPVPGVHKVSDPEEPAGPMMDWGVVVDDPSLKFRVNWPEPLTEELVMVGEVPGAPCAPVAPVEPGLPWGPCGPVAPRMGPRSGEVDPSV